MLQVDDVVNLFKMLQKPLGVSPSLLSVTIPTFRASEIQITCLEISFIRQS